MATSPQLPVLSTPRPSFFPAASAAISYPAPAALSCPDTLVGPSAALSRLWSQIRRIAPHVRTALLCGETGTGAETVARTLHSLSPFAQRSLLVLSAAEAETQLRHPRTFAATLADTGLLFLAEIEHLSPSAQRALLRLLRWRRHLPLCVIGSTVTDLRALVAAGSFLPELATELGSLRLQLPTLRERSEDLPLLLDRLFLHHAGLMGRPAPVLTPEFLGAALGFSWPGNLSQLEAAVLWLLEHVSTASLRAEDLALALEGSAPAEELPPAPLRMVTLDSVMHEHVRAVLVGCNGNKLRAAEILGISRSTLYRMLDNAAAETASMAH